MICSSLKLASRNHSPCPSQGHVISKVRLLVVDHRLQTTTTHRSRNRLRLDFVLTDDHVGRRIVAVELGFEHLDPLRPTIDSDRNRVRPTLAQVDCEVRVGVEIVAPTEPRVSVGATADFDFEGPSSTDLVPDLDLMMIAPATDRERRDRRAHREVGDYCRDAPVERIARPFADLGRAADGRHRGDASRERRGQRRPADSEEVAPVHSSEAVVARVVVGSAVVVPAGVTFGDLPPIPRQSARPKPRPVAQIRREVSLEGIA